MLVNQLIPNLAHVLHVVALKDIDLQSISGPDFKRNKHDSPGALSLASLRSARGNGNDGVSGVHAGMGATVTVFSRSSGRHFKKVSRSRGVILLSQTTLTIDLLWAAGRESASMFLSTTDKIHFITYFTSHYHIYL